MQKMLRSKSRSGLSRTISSSLFCRGDPLNSQINALALKPLERNNSHGHAASPSEVVSQLVEELKMTKALLEAAEQDKDRAVDELREIKMGIEMSKQIDSRATEKDMLIDGLEVELSIFKASRSIITESLSESKRKIKELEMEIEKLRLFKRNTDPENPKLDDPFLVGKLDNKEKLEYKERELEKVKQELEQNIKLLNEAKRENEHYQTTVERLRFEVDESVLAWNEREIGFVKCVKEADDEKTRIQQENIRLVESLRSANATVDMFREENIKLKVILQQSKGIAMIEQSFQLNKTRSEHDESLDFPTRENKKLSVKEPNRPLLVTSMKDPKSDSRKQGAKTKSMKTMFDDSKKGKIQKNRLSFDLSELKRANSIEDVRVKVGDEVPVKAEILTGSVFDNVDPPKHTRRVSFSILNDKPGAKAEDFDRLEMSDVDDIGNSWIWKRRAFLQSFEDLIKGRNVEKE